MLIIFYFSLSVEPFCFKVCTLYFRENFLKVDIFYPELSYEEIEQNIAFEFLSLLSEVGGFLGLLLGASVLTVFELVDYISLSFLNKLQVERRMNGRPVD